MATLKALKTMSGKPEASMKDFWAKLILVGAMILGSDPVSEPVINHCYSFHLGIQIQVMFENSKKEL